MTEEENGELPEKAEDETLTPNTAGAWKATVKNLPKIETTYSVQSEPLVQANADDTIIKKVNDDEQGITLNSLNENFTYTIAVMVPENIGKLIITDSLFKFLSILNNEVTVTKGDGSSLEKADIKISPDSNDSSKNIVTVTIDDKTTLGELAESWIKVGFSVSIQESVTMQNLIDAYGSRGIIWNKAAYTTDLSPSIEVESNVVTVTPPEDVAAEPEDPQLSTEANPRSVEGEKAANGPMTVTDILSYRGLQVGESYTVKGYIMDKDTGEAVATSTGTFTADGSVGTWTMTYDDVTLEPGKTYVIFEEITTADGRSVVAHKDMTDPYQTITVTEFTVPEPETPSEEPDPEETPDSTEPAEPEETPAPAEEPKPEEPPKQEETPASTETPEPEKTSEPAESPKAEEAPKVEETPTLAETPRLVSPVALTETPKEAPRTGDENNIAKYILLLLTAGAGCAFCIRHGARRRRG